MGWASSWPSSWTGDRTLRTLAAAAIAFLDLLEAEGRVLRARAIRVGIGLALVAVAAVVALIGLCCGVWAVYLYLDTWFAPPAAAGLAGLVALAGAGVLLWLAKRSVR